MIHLNKIARKALSVAEKSAKDGENVNPSFMELVKHIHVELADFVEELFENPDDDNQSKLYEKISDIMLCCLIIMRKVWRIDSSLNDVESVFKKYVKKNRYELRPIKK